MIHTVWIVSAMTSIVQVISSKETCELYSLRIHATFLSDKYNSFTQEKFNSIIL